MADFFGRWWVRLPVQFVLLLALYILFGTLLGQGVKALHLSQPGPLRVAGAVAAGAIGIFVYRRLVWRMEKRPADELSRRGVRSGLAGGVLLGVAIFTAVIGILGVMGYAQVTALPTIAMPWTELTSALLAAVFEELIMRGVLFRIVEDRFNSLAALVVSAAVFGLVHGANHGATIVSTLCIAFEAGLLLAAAYMVTRSLWLPIGLHFGWNFTEGGLFGAAVSGGKAEGIVKTVITGPPLISGGEFGPEASLIALAVCLLVTAILLAIAIRRGHWRRAGVPA
jgi:membrane protease YdiL (CAAX protease family)